MISDQFDTPNTTHEDDKVKRDRWGRYLLTHPVTGTVEPFTRATTFAKSISDTFTLSQWSQRMVAKGMAMRPDLAALMHSKDVAADRAEVNDICETAKAAAGDKVAANLGTARHAFTELVDSRPDEDPEDLVPAEALPDVLAYQEALRQAGFVVADYGIERITAVPEWGVAGTLDRLLNQRLGAPLVVGDLKTGRDLSYGWNEIAIQLLIYAKGADEHGLYDLATGTWDTRTCGSVLTNFAVVMHLPVGKAKCTLYRVDLKAAERAAYLCRDVREWRKRRDLATQWVISEVEHEPPAESREPTWEERFGSATTRGELSALYREAVNVLFGPNPDRLDKLVETGQRRLRELEEKSG